VAVEVGTWPLPRRKRSPPSSFVATPDELGGAASQARSWAFSINESAANVRATVVSPRFVGPGYIVDMILYGLAINQTNPFTNVQVTCSQSAGIQGNNQAASARPPGISLFDSSDLPEFSAPNNLGPGIPFLNGVAGTIAVPIRLNYRAGFDPFFVNVSLVVQIALQQIFQGIIRVVENAPEASPEWLMS